MIYGQVGDYKDKNISKIIQILRVLPILPIPNQTFKTTNPCKQLASIFMNYVKILIERK